MPRLKFVYVPPETDPQSQVCDSPRSCLICQREKCVDEVPRGQEKIRIGIRNRQILLMREQGKSPQEIAYHFHLHIRTVQRTLSPFYVRKQKRRKS